MILHHSYALLLRSLNSTDRMYYLQSPASAHIHSYTFPFLWNIFLTLTESIWAINDCKTPSHLINFLLASSSCFSEFEYCSHMRRSLPNTYHSRFFAVYQQSISLDKLQCFAHNLHPISSHSNLLLSFLCTPTKKKMWFFTLLTGVIMWSLVLRYSTNDFAILLVWYVSMRSFLAFIFDFEREPWSYLHGSVSNSVFWLLLLIFLCKCVSSFMFSLIFYNLR